jgi:hypothetical protein
MYATHASYTTLLLSSCCCEHGAVELLVGSGQRSSTVCLQMHWHVTLLLHSLQLINLLNCRSWLNVTPSQLHSSQSQHLPLLPG